MATQINPPPHLFNVNSSFYDYKGRHIPGGGGGSLCGTTANFILISLKENSGKPCNQAVKNMLFLLNQSALRDYVRKKN